jgi:hypothetical protein
MTRTGIISAAPNTSALLDEAKHDALGAAHGSSRWSEGRALAHGPRRRPGSADPLNKADKTAAGRAATQVCDGLVASAKTAPDFEGRVPSLVVLTDANGMTIGRNGS